MTSLNRAVDERKPWVLAREKRDGELDALLYDLCEGLRWLAVLLHPVMPERMEEMWRRLGAGDGISAEWTAALGSWGGLQPGARIASGEPLFPRIERAAVEA